MYHYYACVVSGHLLVSITTAAASHIEETVDSRVFVFVFIEIHLAAVPAPDDVALTAVHVAAAARAHHGHLALRASAAVFFDELNR